MKHAVDSEIRGVFANFVVLASSKVAVMVLGMLGIMVTIWFLGPSKYGALSLLVGLVQLLYLASFGWLANSVVRFGREEAASSGIMNRMFWSRALMGTACLIVVSAAVIVARRPIAGYISIPENDFILIFSYLAVFILADYGNYLLQAMGRMKSYAFSAVLERGCYLGFLLIVFLLRPGQHILEMVLGLMIVSKMAQAAYAFFSMDRGVLTPFVVDKTMLKQMALYSLPVLALFPAAYFSEWGDLWVVKFYLPLSAVGVYQTAYQALLSLTQVYMVITVLLFPLITSLRAGGRDEAVRTFLVKVAPQMVFVWSILLSFVVFFGDYIFALLFGPEFHAGSKAILVLIATSAFVGVSGVYSAIHTSYDLLHWSMGLGMVTAVLNIILDFSLIPVFGVTGAAFATLIAYLVNASGYMLIGNRRLGVKASSAVLAMAPAFLVMAISLSVSNFLLRTILFVIIIELCVIVVRRLRLFKTADLSFFDKIQKPQIIQNALVGIYTWLEGPGVETIVTENRNEK